MRIRERKTCLEEMHFPSMQTKTVKYLLCAVSCYRVVYITTNDSSGGGEGGGETTKQQQQVQEMLKGRQRE